MPPPPTTSPSATDLAFLVPIFLILILGPVYVKARLSPLSLPSTAR